MGLPLDNVRSKSHGWKRALSWAYLLMNREWVDMEQL